MTVKGDFGVKKKDHKGTWFEGVTGFALVILIALTIRWLLVEPYVIPSEG